MKYSPAAASPADSGRAAALYAMAAIVLGIGASIVRPDPATALTLMAGVLASAAFILSVVRPSDRGEPFLERVLIVGIVGYVGVGLIAPALLDAWYRPVLVLTGAMAIAAVLLPRLRTLLVVAVVVAHAAIAGWLITSLTLPYMDVHLFQQEASQALIDGANPYELRYLNIYGEGTHLYAPEVQDGDLLTFGFPYPPLSLLMAIPGYVLGGDYRFAAIAAVSGTALLLAFTRRNGVGAGAAAMFLMSPLTLRVLYNGWTESFVGVLLAASVYSAVRHPRTTPILLGLLIASKQYVVPVLLPAVATLTAVRHRVGAQRMVGWPIAIAAATIVPFLVWNPGEFIHSVVLLQAYQPFRPDSVSIPGLLARLEFLIVPTWAAFVVAAVVLATATRWAPRTPAGFAGATAIFFLAFFLVSKQAFMNYYFLVQVALVCAVAAASVSLSTLRTSKEREGSRGYREGAGLVD